MKHKLYFYLLSIITKHFVKQGHTHKKDITKMYQMIYDAAKNEFTEDNTITLHNFLNECYFNNSTR